MLAAIVSLFVTLLGAHGSCRWVDSRTFLNWMLVACRPWITHVIKVFLFSVPHMQQCGYPAGYAPIHILASGVDQNFLRPELIKQLIEKKADIEATRTFSRMPAPI